MRMWIIAICLGVICAYLGLPTIVTLAVVLAVGLTIEALAPSEKTKARKEDRGWMKADPHGYWEAHRPVNFR